jgi:hypothetical protein
MAPVGNGGLVGGAMGDSNTAACPTASGVGTAAAGTSVAAIVGLGDGAGSDVGVAGPVTTGVGSGSVSPPHATATAIKTAIKVATILFIRYSPHQFCTGVYGATLAIYNLYAVISPQDFRQRWPFCHEQASARATCGPNDFVGACHLLFEGRGPISPCQFSRARALQLTPTKIDPH